MTFIDTKSINYFILPNQLIEELLKNYAYIWSKFDDNISTVRFVTSWATKKRHISLLESIKSFKR